MNLQIIVVKWFPNVVLKVLQPDMKLPFGKLERASIKLETLKSHRRFNLTCLNIYILAVCPPLSGLKETWINNFFKD